MNQKDVADLAANAAQRALEKYEADLRAASLRREEAARAGERSTSAPSELGGVQPGLFQNGGLVSTLETRTVALREAVAFRAAQRQRQVPSGATYMPSPFPVTLNQLCQEAAVLERYLLTGEMPKIPEIPDVNEPLKNKPTHHW